MPLSLASIYEDVRPIVLSYLQAKWTPSGTYVQHGGRKHHDPDAIDIGRSGIKAPSVAGEIARGAKEKETPKAKEKKRARREKERAGHTAKECWYNTKGQGKGRKGRGVRPLQDCEWCGVPELQLQVRGDGDDKAAKAGQQSPEAMDSRSQGRQARYTHKHIYIYIHQSTSTYIYIYTYIESGTAWRGDVGKGELKRRTFLYIYIYV